jgi:hypothetical protein
MKHPADPHIEYFAFRAPDGICIVAMLRGVWVEVLDALQPQHLTCPRILRVCAALRGEVRRHVERANRLTTPASAQPLASPAN